MRRSALIVAPYLPLPADFGGALRIYNLIAHLSRSWDVSLLAPGGPDDLPALQTLGEICNVTLVPAESTARQPASRTKRVAQLRSLASGRSFLQESSWNPQMQAALDRIVGTRRIDLVQQEFPESSFYRPPREIPVIFDAHNVEFDLLARIARNSGRTSKRAYNLMESRKVRRLEVRAWEQATRVVATSDRDAGIIRSLSSTPVDVVPNGVDLDRFTVQPVECSRPAHVVFTGAMRHQPNADGAAWYAEHVHPLVQNRLPETRLAIVGADPPPPVLALASDSITVTGRVEDILPYLAGAQVVAVPLWSGGGTRLKILEAFAAGRPVVSTSIGAEGLDVEHGKHLLLADTPDSFAAAVADVHDKPDLATHLTAHARALVEKRYGWDTVTSGLLETFDHALGT